MRLFSFQLLFKGGLSSFAFMLNGHIGSRRALQFIDLPLFLLKGFCTVKTEYIGRNKVWEGI